jgi:hypothetical protein
MTFGIRTRAMLSLGLLATAWLGTAEKVEAVELSPCAFCVDNELCVEISQYDDQCKLICGGNTYSGYCADAMADPTGPCGSSNRAMVYCYEMSLN